MLNLFILLQSRVLPATGDSNNILLWCAVAVVALAACVTTLVVTLRRKPTEQTVDSMITTPGNFTDKT